MKRSPFFVLLAFVTFLISQNRSRDAPVWTHYARGGTAHIEQWGGLAFYRIKRVKSYSFHDLRLLGIFIPHETLVTVRYKSSQKFERFPGLYRFTVTSLRKSSTSGLKIRYHYNQGFGVFAFDLPSTHLTAEGAFSYDMSDYLSDTRKTSYLKGGLFWDVDVWRSSVALDLEYFRQISDVIPGENVLSRYELSTEVNLWIKGSYAVTVGYEEEFYFQDIPNVRSVYVAFGFKRRLPFTL